MNTTLSATEVFDYLRHELKAHKAEKLGDLELSYAEDDSDAGINYLQWNYTPNTNTGLDASMYYDDNGYGRINLGPVNFYFEPEQIVANKENLLKIILMVLNGQFKVVLTYPEIGGFDRFQAAEVYLLGLEKQPTILRVLSNHTRSARKLRAVTLSNAEDFSAQIVTPDFWLLPEKTNGKYPRGRKANFNTPVPLDRKTYNALDESLTIQALGGEPDEPFWSYFYRTTEFWLVAIPFFALDLWILDTFLREDSLLSVVIKNTMHLANTAVVLYITSKLLARRHAKLDAGQTPRFERNEDVITLFGISRVFTVTAVCTLLFAPMWTPAGDFTNMFPGTKYIFIYPILFVGCILMLAPLFFDNAAKLGGKLLVSLVYSIGIALVFITNGLYMNTADNAPTVAAQWIALGLFLPVMINIWMYYKTFAKPNPRGTRDWA